jgi:hypothetical protein
MKWLLDSSKGYMTKLWRSKIARRLHLQMLWENVYFAPTLVKIQKIT